MSDPLPIDDALPALTDALRRAGRAVLQAPPGAGKTTRVPLALLDAGLVLCRHLGERRAELQSLGVSKERIPLILEEAERLCR